MSNAHVSPTMLSALRAVIPPSRMESAGVIKYGDEERWRVHWLGKVSDDTFATRTDAIRELAKRDAAHAFCEGD